MKLRCNNLEQCSCIDNIELVSVPEATNENLNIILEKIDLGIDCLINRSDYSTAHHVQHINNATHAPGNIIVKFISLSKKEETLAAAKRTKKFTTNSGLPGLAIPGLWESIFINEHPTTDNEQLLKKTKDTAKSKQYKFIWVRNCIIYVCKNETTPATTIKRESDISKMWYCATPWLFLWFCASITLNNIATLYLNVNGLRTKTHIYYNNLLNSDYDILCLTETSLISGITNSELFCDKYNVYRRDRKPQLSQWSVVEVYLLLFQKTATMQQLLWNSLAEDLEVIVGNGKNHFQLCVVYLPPRGNASFMTYMDSIQALHNNQRVSSNLRAFQFTKYYMAKQS